MMINFALHPDPAYQPNGHRNVSRVREVYLSWTGVTDGTAAPLRTPATSPVGGAGGLPQRQAPP